MLQLGKKQELTVIKQVNFGVYLAEGEGASEKVLLPQKEVPENTEVGTKLEVFLYKDSKDRLIATRRTPMLEIGEVAQLTVKEVAKIGAFLDWGLEKDLLLPFKEQTKRVREGDQILAALYIDKSSRLCATMKIYPYLCKNSPYKKDDHVSGIVYEVSREFGAFVAVDGKYSGLIQAKEAGEQYHPGDQVELRVTGVKPDGKLDLSAREKAYLQIDEDAEAVMGVIEEFEGVLPFNDKVSPEIIQREFGLSKNAFKRAVGRLLKQGRIEITENRIRKIK
ncbi:MAG: S1-like domain-containing RNA-binding protein [Lachnospiraceae bacterium]|nr:S1-like domain-containing RNA-binding protein [Robinsoniella sp.]MDY3767164.1 S1-like domain-containing RNA-binding protein [Lachnospiraceae bacterium]